MAPSERNRRSPKSRRILRLDEQTAKGLDDDREEKGRKRGRSNLTNWSHFLHKVLDTFFSMAAFAPTRADGHEGVQVAAFNHAILFPAICERKFKLDFLEFRCKFGEKNATDFESRVVRQSSIF